METSTQGDARAVDASRAGAALGATGSDLPGDTGALLVKRYFST
jgi:hypothetical protein